MTKRLSIVLVDWGVRESFHTIRALHQQTVPRDEYEVLWVEYYDKLPGPVRQARADGLLDDAVALGGTGMYFKHQAYNAGVLKASAPLVVIANSDDLMRPTFVDAVLQVFTNPPAPRVYLQLDRADNHERSHFPIDAKYPGVPPAELWDRIIKGPGMYEFNHEKMLPRGLVEDDEPHQADGITHLRDFGSCFAARRADILNFGGFDEHASYRSFWCGPYELAWRMRNAGWKEVWHPSECVLGVWHPWINKDVDDVQNQGIVEHAGVSKTALGIRSSGRIVPLVMNDGVRSLLSGGVSA